MKITWEMLKILSKKSPWRKILDFVPEYRPGKPIEEVKREYGLDKAVKLASNENPFVASDDVVEAVAREARNANRYPDGACYYLRKELSDRLSVPRESLVFGNGSDELILLAVRAFITRGSNVVIADPTFLIYRLASVLGGARVKMVPVKDHRYDLNAMRKAINRKTKIVFIANPDNPSGSYVTSGELNDFIESVPRDVLVFIDEAYYDYATGGDYPETIDLIKREDRNIIVTRTFSKAYGLAGMRIGYGIARPALASALNKVREPFSVNSLAQAAAIAALKDDEHVARSVSLVKEERKRFYEFFESLGVEYVPSRTNFILFKSGRDSKGVYDCLLKKGVIIREMTIWGLQNYNRVTIGLPEENDMFFKAFSQAMEELKKI